MQIHREANNMAAKKITKFYVTLVSIFVLGIIFLLGGPFYIVNEGEQCVVTRLGRLVDSKTDAGLYTRVPFLDTVTIYPKRILSLEGDKQPIPTKEQQYIVVDTTIRWKITDPLEFYKNLQTLPAAYNKLSDIVDSAARTVITRNRLIEIVRSSNIINTQQEESVANEDTAEIEELVRVNVEYDNIQFGRAELCNQMTEEANKLAPEYGIRVIDIVPRQIKYSDELTESVYNRMIKDRNQIAQAYRSLGQGRKEKLLGQLENEKLSIQSNAYRQAEEIKGKADAEAAKLYAEAYSKDSEFYSFWKSLESYKQTLGKTETTYSTNMNYFDYLYSPEGKR